MSSTAELTLDQALAMARRLSPQNQAALITRLIQGLVSSPTPAPPAPGDAWTQWAALRDEIGREHPDARLAERLEADRRERDAVLGGNSEAGDVHP